MGLLYDTGIVSGGLSQTTISTSPGYEFQQLAIVNLACANPIALSSVTAILRWNDGLSNRSYTQLVLLTSLNQYISVPISILQAPNDALSLEINVIGSGQYRYCVYTRDITA